MPLVDRQIHEAVRQGELGIDNFAPELVQPASYDLRVGPLVYAAPNPDRPTDLSRNGGAFRLPPYASALFMTYESLHMPITLAGRFGLTSSFARKGLVASTGPQVDPGFEGKLFVSLVNLAPVSHVIKYKDTFLSIVFERLDAKPDHPYRGPYQGKFDITGEILEDLVRLEGVNLSQMQSQFTELAEHVKAWSTLAARFDEFLLGMTRQAEALARHTEAVERLVNRFAEQAPMPPLGAVEARQVDGAQAKAEILDLFRRRRERLYYSDIAETLRLDFATVIDACRELEHEGLIEGVAGE